MEENENYEKNCFLCRHPLIKCLLSGLLIFLGAFCAFYVVADWHFKRLLDPMTQIRKFDREMARQEKQLDQFAKKEFKIHDNNMKNNQVIRAEQLPDAYKITIDLRPFDNNEKNVEVKTEGNMLLIDAAGETNSKNNTKIVKYSQAFRFGESIKTNEITKVREGNNYIITVPID